jgi:hypothetical protein
MSFPFLPFAVPRPGGSIRASRERKAARASGTEGTGRTAWSRWRMAIPVAPTLPSRTGIAASSIGSVRLWRGRLARRSSSRNDQPAKASSPFGWGDEEAVSGLDVQSVAPRCGLAWGCTPSPASVSAKARVPTPVVRRRDRRPNRAHCEASTDWPRVSPAAYRATTQEDGSDQLTRLTLRSCRRRGRRPRRPGAPPAAGYGRHRL